jgi:hypothetical protein
LKSGEKARNSASFRHIPAFQKSLWTGTRWVKNKNEKTNPSSWKNFGFNGLEEFRQKEAENVKNVSDHKKAATQ